MDSIKVFSPGSITNLSCGYDILGLCLQNRGDEITVSYDEGTFSLLGL